MNLADAILEHDRARRAGEDAPIPATGGRRIVCVTCTELAGGAPTVASRFGLDADQVLVVAVPGARVPRQDGDVARAVALAAGAAGGTLGGAAVIVLGHEGCAFRAPTFAVPGPAPQGESFPTETDLLRAAVTQLRASPWMTRTVVEAILLDPSGRLDIVRVESGGAASAPGPHAAAPLAAPGAATIAPSGPVSFFGAPGAAPSLSSSPAPSLGAPLPLMGGAAGSLGGNAGSLGGTAGPASLSAPGAIRWDTPPPVALMPGVASLATPLPPTPPSVMPTVGAMPTVGPLPAAPPPLAAPAGPTADVETASFEMLGRALGQVIDAPAPGAPPAPPPPPPPKPAPPDRASQRHARPQSAPPAPPPPAATPSGSSADDPFKRAEEILERLRREKRR
jgi:hypothetical protein